MFNINFKKNLVAKIKFFDKLFFSKDVSNYEYFIKFATQKSIKN